MGAEINWELRKQRFTAMTQGTMQILPYWEAVYDEFQKYNWLRAQAAALRLGVTLAYPALGLKDLIVKMFDQSTGGYREWLVRSIFEERGL